MPEHLGSITRQHRRLDLGAAKINPNSKIAHIANLAKVVVLAQVVQRPQNTEIMGEKVLDAKGLRCPLPVLRANRELRGLAPGERLRVLATDRAAVGDFQAFCRETGHALLAWSEEGGTFSFLIRRRAETG